ncbi:MAG: alpha/beta fold hydrolase [Candidatus Micrarchaeota archaeon]|nr:alpha/beta fold hydrolase [Candidatus Micrarchaeota archaeon]
MDYDSDFNEGYVHSSFGRIYYRRHKTDGKKLIFLHGLGGTTKAWAKLMTFIPEEFDVSLIDLLGHGKSDAPADIDYKISEQVQALTEFISDQNNRESCIIGHSYGGWIAAYYASYPYTASSFVLEDSAGLEEDREFNSKDRGERDKKIEELAKFSLSKEVAEKILLSLQNERLTKDTLSKIEKPTLIVWGSEDSTVNVEYANSFKNDIKNSKLEIIEGAGHAPHYTNAEQFAKIVIDFIRSINA